MCQGFWEEGVTSKMVPGVVELYLKGAGQFEGLTFMGDKFHRTSSPHLHSSIGTRYRWVWGLCIELFSKSSI